MAKKYPSRVYEYDDEDEEFEEERNIKSYNGKEKVVERKVEYVQPINNTEPIEKNVVAQVIKTISYIIIICGFICLLFWGNIAVGLGYLIACLISAAFIYAIGEIIQILHDIRKKLYEKNDVIRKS